MEETITINGNPIAVKKLPLRKYPQIIGVVREIQGKTSILTGDTTTDQILAALPQLVTDCYPDVVQVLQIALDRPKEEIEEWGLDDLIEVVRAFFTVNRFGFIYEQIKKIMANPQAKQLTDKAQQQTG